MSKNLFHFSAAIYQGNNIIEAYQDFHRKGLDTQKVIDQVKRESQMALEHAVIASGQFSNYNNYFIILKRNDKPWMLAEYRPTFQYSWHIGKSEIMNFLLKLGVKYAEI